MILPTKHIRLENSLLGIGNSILKLLDSPKTVSDLWSRAESQKVVNNFRRFTLTLSFLYTIGAVEYEDGFIKRVEE